MLIKIIIVVVLFIIIGSLFSALYFLSKDKAGSDRTVKALTLRIGLSMLLFIGILLAYYFGYISPHR